MAVMDNILVKDDTVTTPVEFTLVPVADNPDCIWRASVANVPMDGQVRLTLHSEVLKNGGSKMTAKLEVPVLETLGASGTSAGYTAPPKVAYVTTCIFTMFSDRRSTSQNRADTLKMALGILQGASATTATGILANTAAGNAFVNSTLPITQAFTRVIKPS
jgi:hypothetical protein